MDIVQEEDSRRKEQDDSDVKLWSAVLGQADIEISSPSSQTGLRRKSARVASREARRSEAAAAAAEAEAEKLRSETVGALPQHKRKQRSESLSEVVNDGATSRTRKLREAKRSKEDTDDSRRHSSLFELVLSHPSALRSTVSDWIRRLNRKGRDAVAEVLDFVIRSAKSDDIKLKHTVILTRNVLASDQDKMHQTVQEITEDMQGASTCILLKKERSARRFRRAYEEFWVKVVRECPPDLLYGTGIFDLIVTWLQRMSAARSTPLRLAAALASYRLLDGVNETIRAQKESQSLLQSQLDVAERKRHMRRSPSGREGSDTEPRKRGDLRKKIEEITQHCTELDDLSKHIYSGVFVFRYRDSYPQLRALSIASLGRWVLDNSASFLTDLHIKYMGWLLYDRVSMVRSATVTALLNLVNTPDIFPSLEIFVRRFRKRLLEMVRDCDLEVAEKAVELCKELLKFDVLGVDERKSIFDVLREVEETVAAGDSYSRRDASSLVKAVGAFIAECLRSQLDREGISMDDYPSSESVVAAKTAADDKQQAPTKRVLRQVASATLTAGGRWEDVPLLVVKAVWDSMPALRDWKAYLDLLESEEEETEILVVLARLLYGAIAHGQNLHKKSRLENPICASAGSDGDRMDEDEMDGSTIEAFTKLVTPRLGLILEKHQAEASMFSVLVKLLDFVDLNYFKLAGLEAELAAILSHLRNGSRRHAGSVETVESIVSSLARMASEPSSIQPQALAALMSSALDAEKSLAEVAEREEADMLVQAPAVLTHAKLVAENVEFPSTFNALETAMKVAQILWERREVVHDHAVVDSMCLVFLLWGWLVKASLHAHEAGSDFRRLLDLSLEMTRRLIIVIRSDAGVLMRAEAVVVSMGFLSVILGAASSLRGEGTISEDAIRKRIQESEEQSHLKDAMHACFRTTLTVAQDADVNLDNHRGYVVAIDRIVTASAQASLRGAISQGLFYLPLLVLSARSTYLNEDTISFGLFYLERLHKGYPGRTVRIELEAIHAVNRHAEWGEDRIGRLANRLATHHANAGDKVGANKLVLLVIAEVLSHETVMQVFTAFKPLLSDSDYQHAAERIEAREASSIGEDGELQDHPQALSV